MEMVAPLSFDEDIHNNKIGTNERNTIGRSEGDVSKEEGGEKFLNGPRRQRNHQNQLEQQWQGKKWRIYTVSAVKEAGWGRNGRG